MNTFSIDEAIAFGWRVTKEKFWFLVGWFLIVAAIGYAPAFLDTTFRLHGLASGIVHIAAIVVSIIVSMVSIRMFLNLVDGKPASYNDLLSEKDLFLPFIAASFVVAILTGIGLIL